MTCSQGRPLSSTSLTESAPRERTRGGRVDDSGLREAPITTGAHVKPCAASDFRCSRVLSHFDSQPVFPAPSVRVAQASRNPGRCILSYFVSDARCACSEAARKPSRRPQHTASREIVSTTVVCASACASEWSRRILFCVRVPRMCVCVEHEP